MSGSFYVVGGQQKASAHGLPEWQRHQCGMIVEVDLDRGSHEVRAEYVSPPEACPDDDPSNTFKSSTLEGDSLYVCTQTEVLVYKVPEFELTNYISLPFFNDLHHVAPTPRGTLLIAVTGLDMVAEITSSGELVREWGVLGTSPWERFDRTVDYRKVSTTKPHASHPNFVFETGGEVWVTRFVQRDALCLTDPPRRIAIDVNRVHDGHVHGDKAYFTAVDGHVVVAGHDSCEVEQVYNLNRIEGGIRPLGWCRGLAVESETQAVVGFSRLRWTKFRANVGWTRGLRVRLANLKKRPTRIVRYDLAEGKSVAKYDLEPAGMSVIFSIIPTTP